MSASDPVITAVGPDDLADLAILFDSAGVTQGCWCMWWRVPARVFDAMTQPERRATFEAQAMDHPPGLLARIDGCPAGWVQVTPRADLPRFNASRAGKAAKDTDLDRDWAMTCFFIHKDFRGQGLMEALGRAACVFAVQNGAAAVEAAAHVPSGDKLQWSDGYTGLAPVLSRVGFLPVGAQSGRRQRMRWTA
ncbi:GNAT family N-acetyltransferase [Maliponia aquimaris]|uniref:N-acetyltransferase domain-containing protein n=1 Tax=Maliponia aquimaris TaxID=1673631 RepID=A0A238L7N9_9RHOB|nr:GNAT family N-acetyltransferase [Maliponia aquimaris]SMX50861.1 hypothetical protein MAA8898_05063 [Maliponia aquimaris]